MFEGIKIKKKSLKVIIKGGIRACPLGPLARNTCPLRQVKNEVNQAKSLLTSPTKIQLSIDRMSTSIKFGEHRIGSVRMTIVSTATLQKSGVHS